MYEMQEKMATQRELMMKVDRDRDGCRMELDEKTEKMADMEDIIKNLTTANGELQNASSKLRAQLDGTMKALGDHEKTILYLQKQIEGAKAEREKMLVANEGMEEEIGHLKTDLGATMRENQILNGELAEVCGCFHLLILTTLSYLPPHICRLSLTVTVSSVTSPTSTNATTFSPINSSPKTEKRSNSFPRTVKSSTTMIALKWR
ncbi:hypothetical protein BC829DRAFT_172857 [Chytridium lagenaria]|nr:hypothetical protein BC829DRAFT_172857 [Chytridium lagenaria]